MSFKLRWINKICLRGKVTIFHEKKWNSVKCVTLPLVSVTLSGGFQNGVRVEAGLGKQLTSFLQ